MQFSMLETAAEPVAPRTVRFGREEIEAGFTPPERKIASLDLGPLQPLMDDSSISDILVNGADTVYVERAGKLHLTDVRFRSNAELLTVIQRIVSVVGRRVDASSPLVDARLPDGSRVNAAVAPVAVDGPSLSIRRFGRTPLLTDDLVAKSALTSEMVQVLQACVQMRLNLLISGGTGSGKTTLLNALSSFIPERERIVTIEDAAELRLQQRHVVRLETKPLSTDGPAVQIRQLVVNALRMRPDRIVVGEVRSDEALDMLQAMNTGHDGSLTTIHANSPRDALNRLEIMVGMANSSLGVRNIRQQITSAMHLIVQVARLSDGTRKVLNITECLGLEGDIVTLQDLFTFEKTGLTPEGRVTGRFRGTGMRPKFFDKLKGCGIELPLSLFSSVMPVN
jgi:pilus assembly protein CpaF